MEKVTSGKCTCIHTSGSINVIMPINLPDFHAQVRNFLNGNKSTTMNSDKLQQQVAKQHCAQFMTPANFANAHRAVEHHLITAGLQRDFQEFPVFLRLLIEQNKQTTSSALQTEHGNNTFSGFLWDSQLLCNWGN